MEAQRLITLSLGKIAQSKAKRTGVNLHKNLLVSTVLHKAKNAFYMESYNTMKGSIKVQEPVINESFESDVEDVEEDDIIDSSEMEFELETDKENSPPERDCSEIVSYESQDSVVVKSDSTENESLSSMKSCGGCKRRRESSDNEECSPSKMSKTGHSDYNCSQSSMDNNSQISSLVNTFNNGFTGLTTNSNKGNISVTSAQSQSVISNNTTCSGTGDIVKKIDIQRQIAIQLVV